MPFDITITEGLRTLEKQKEFVAKGSSWTLKSKHLKQEDGWSHAIDLVPYPVDWDDKSRFNEMARIVLETAKDMGVSIRWGGDWNMNGDWKDERKYDGPHFELY